MEINVRANYLYKCMFCGNNWEQEEFYAEICPKCESEYIMRVF